MRYSLSLKIWQQNLKRTDSRFVKISCFADNWPLSWVPLSCEFQCCNTAIWRHHHHRHYNHHHEHNFNHNHHHHRQKSFLVCCTSANSVALAEWATLIIPPPTTSTTTAPFGWWWWWTLFGVTDEFPLLWFVPPPSPWQYFKSVHESTQTQCKARTGIAN